MSYFTYNQGLSTTNGAFRISASQLSKFFDSTSQWYREHLLGEAGFEGSVNSHLGTVVHAAAAMYIDSKSISKSEIATYISSLDSLTSEERQFIADQHKPMIEALVNQYLSTAHITESESFLFQEILPGIGVGGSCDAYDQHSASIIDFKTTSSKTPPTKFPRAYWFQLMTYAWLYKQQGKPVDYLKLIYVTTNEVGRISEKTGKPLQDYPSTVTILTEQVTAESLELIEGCIRLIADSVAYWQSHPEHRYLLAQDYRLKLPTKATPTLFKD